MSNERLKINLLTKLKMSLGIDTRADEINIEINDLKNKKQQIVEEKNITENKLSIINPILTDIDQIEQLAKSDVLNGFAKEYSAKIISYKLSIERAKKQNVDIEKIVEMEQNYFLVVKECCTQYINAIINKKENLNGNYLQIKILINNIINNLNRLDLNCSISSYEDLENTYQHLQNQKYSFMGIKENYVDKENLLRSKIFNIENSYEKYLADYAVENAKNRKKQ